MQSLNYFRSSQAALWQDNSSGLKSAAFPLVLRWRCRLRVGWMARSPADSWPLTFSPLDTMVAGSRQWLTKINHLGGIDLSVSPLPLAQVRISQVKEGSWKQSASVLLAAVCSLLLKICKKIASSARLVPLELAADYPHLSNWRLLTD